VLAFANCGRAVAPVRGSYVPLNEPASQERAARGAGGADEVTR